MATFTEPFTESFTESDPERSLPDQGAGIREQGTRDLRDVVPIHRHLCEGPRPATMDGRFAASLGCGRP